VEPAVSATACALLRHDVIPRWIGSLRAAYCLTCEHLWITEPIDPPAQARSAPPRLDQGAEYADWAPGELVFAFGK
jgi:hypothetical protein